MAYFSITNSGDDLLDALIKGRGGTQSRHHDRLFELLLKIRVGASLEALHREIESKFPSREAFFDLLRKLTQAGYIYDEDQEEPVSSLGEFETSMAREQIRIDKQSLHDFYDPDAKVGYRYMPDRMFGIKRERWLSLEEYEEEESKGGYSYG